MTNLNTPDLDPTETKEWLDALQAVLQREGPERAHYLLEVLTEQARRSGTYVPYSANTAYINTIPPHLEERSPGDHALEWRIRSFARWNSMAMVVAANREHAGIGGHIASFASSATLYDVGFNHFWKGVDHPQGQDLIYVQGHVAPGIYARAFLEGRLSEEQLLRFRMEALKPGLPSYPHPWLLPDFWQFATVSMGLGPIQAIYQARLMKYLENRGLAKTEGRKVWCFCGDGEMDEPESLGAMDIAAREKLDNLIFVVNCNLQRLDGPVRGNGKIIQELEGTFRGAGWNVIKLIWGSSWDALIAQDTSGKLIQAFNETVDGEYQNYKAKGGKYTREHFFGKYPELERLVSSMSDEDIARLNRGGHDPHKIYAAYAAASKHTGSPTVILAKTVKGYGMGEAGEGQNITHQQKKMGEDALKAFRDRFQIPISDEEIAKTPFYRPADDSPEIQYLKERRKALGGPLPERRPVNEVLEIPPLASFDKQLAGTGEREISTTMAFVQMLQSLCRDKAIGKRVVPIVPDEARTFGMEAMFRSLGIYSVVGQKYKPEDADQLAFYKEDIKGQILEEGITEAGAMSSWIAAATAYANHGVGLIPFYIFYSMFGFQRIGDLCWAAGDMRSRGFLLGATAGRTSLNGEGLQHEDGHSHIFSATIPNCRSYDPAYAYELAVIIQHGMKEMYVDHKDVYYYLSVYNENYAHPPMPAGVEGGIIKGMYLLRSEEQPAKAHVQLIGSGGILQEVVAAAELLKAEWDVTSDVWSVPSFTELARDGQEVERWNLLHPTEAPRKSYVQECLGGMTGPVIASTDWVRAYPEQIRPYVPLPYHVLGTDGFGRSDNRPALRDFFGIDRRWIVVRSLAALAEQKLCLAEKVSQAIKIYGIKPDRIAPWKS
ncbi:pyruvate dehydrogenase (acetyl-transferring), homodimeric type [Sinimarinibacterium sp. CAU 1509]|uniref:pyruvate dehydrogenase (acetyl-transferring), homodimeric type n=1 Tax=Sinimarinibacterium sp. CAU 1509 TaxID=2562283 RepID=UPI0010AC1072|nr:pyruvate dehydrogenase (acetyl-transferring), homodimeric type [Sinimarinibacterium sp. CAU 1509]TJY63265.1 pyruvate dehydrogenase (acetyl-transferring), homodimeric type [Sinimarinibacterium sp. CAU 1509]